jgi:hypothetical protein
VRRIAFVALVAAAACGEAANPAPGPLDRLYLPTGLAVHEGRLLAASSNSDLRYDDVTGGSVIALEPSLAFTAARVSGGVNVRTFAGDLAVMAPGAACGAEVDAPLAFFATRGSNTLNAVSISPAGALACARCEIPLTGPFGDPVAVAAACRGGRARAFVGHLRGPNGQAWISEYELTPGGGADLRHAAVGFGPARALAYDAARDRLWIAGLATATPTPLRWVELAGCTLGAPREAGGCTIGEATFPELPAGLELRSIALSGTPPAGAPAGARRAYLTGRLYDVAAAALAGARTTDAGGVLLVVDLVEAPLGTVDVQLVRSFDGLGQGMQDVRVIERPGRPDVVVALATDEAILWIYDDETHGIRAFPRSDATGAPVFGHVPFGLAVDPEPVGSVVHVYVGGYRESFVTRVNVPIDDPDAADVERDGQGNPRRISGATGGTP